MRSTVIQKVLFTCFMCLFLLVLSGAARAEIGYIDKSGDYIGSWSNDLGVSSTKETTAIAQTLKNDYAEIFRALADDSYADCDVLTSYEVKDGAGNLIGTGSLPVILSESEISAVIDQVDGAVTVSSTVSEMQGNREQRILVFKVKIGKVEYTFKTFRSEVSYEKYIGDDEDGNPIYETVIVSKADAPAEEFVYTKKELAKEYEYSEGAKQFLYTLSKAAKLGLIGASVGEGFNVGTYYSTTQKPLTDIMKETPEGSGYFDFNASAGLKTAFEYYMNPLVGRLSLDEDPKAPKTDAEWETLAGNLDFTKGTVVLLNSDFEKFAADLSEDSINTKGLKISTFKMLTGVKAFKGVKNSENPKSVLSYCVPLAYPYLFEKTGNSYKMMLGQVRVDDTYSLCLYNGFIYDKAFENCGHISELGVARDNFYLFNKPIEDERKGIVIVGCFFESIIDTTSSSASEALFFTGRKITFKGNYSDALKLNEKNAEVIFSQAATNKSGLLPKNIFFASTSGELATYQDNKGIAPEAVEKGQATYKEYEPVSSEGLLSSLIDSTKHNRLDENTLIRICCAFKEVPLRGVMNKDDIDVGVKPAFIIVRNNQYVDDGELLGWLRSEPARAITYVDAEGLIARITGDFQQGLTKLSYENWLKIQDIESELNQKKAETLNGIVRVLSIIVGIGLICFGLIFMGLYWVDIFNTVTDFSFIEKLSRGRLYPIATKDSLVYLATKDSSVKYVTFKYVLVASLVCIAVGIVFCNVTFLLTTITRVFQYIIYTLGAK